MKDWNEMSGDDQLMVERLPALAGIEPDELTRSRFCTRCWYREPTGQERTA